MEMIRKISRILSGKQKAKVGLLIVMMLSGAFLEAIKASTTEMDECDVVVR